MSGLSEPRFQHGDKDGDDGQNQVQSTKHALPSTERRKSLRRSAALDDLPGHIEKVPADRHQNKRGVEENQRADYLMHCEPSPPPETEAATKGHEQSGRDEEC